MPSSWATSAAADRSECGQPDLGVDLGDLAHGPYTSIVGLILARVGRLRQHPGDSIRFADWTTGIHHHAITTVCLRLHRQR